MDTIVDGKPHGIENARSEGNVSVFRGIPYAPPTFSKKFEIYLVVDLG